MKSLSCCLRTDFHDDRKIVKVTTSSATRTERYISDVTPKDLRCAHRWATSYSVGMLTFLRTTTFRLCISGLVDNRVSRYVYDSWTLMRVRLWRRREEVVVPESADLLLLFVGVHPASQGFEKTIFPADSKCSATGRGQVSKICSIANSQFSRC